MTCGAPCRMAPYPPITTKSTSVLAGYVLPAGCVCVADARGVTDAGIFGDILCARLVKRGVTVRQRQGRRRLDDLPDREVLEERARHLVHEASARASTRSAVPDAAMLDRVDDEWTRKDVLAHLEALAVQEPLAGLVGASRESVNKVLGFFRRRS